MTVNDRGSVNRHNGQATVSGTITCSASTNAYLNGQATERLNRFSLAQGSFSTSLPCSTTPSKWTATVTPSSAPFGKGQAQVDVTVNAWDPTYYSNVTVTKSAVVNLSAK